MNYDQYLKEGLSIASGVMQEVRNVIKDRMDVAKARRLTQKDDFILKLRSLRASGDFEDYWKFYELQEYNRNYDKFYVINFDRKNLTLDYR